MTIGVKAVGKPERQREELGRIAARARDRPWLDAVLLVGSLAADTADALSDVDLLVVVRDGRFDEAWAERAVLQSEDALFAWDQRDDPNREIGAHRWLSGDVVLVEALFGTPSSGMRLAPPWSVLAGAPDAAARLIPRPPIERTEMGHSAAHPVEAAYDEFKMRLRSTAVD